jgi:hypothetical protein
MVVTKQKYTSYRKCEAADVTRGMRVKYMPIHGYNDTEQNSEIEVQLCRGGSNKT